MKNKHLRFVPRTSEHEDQCAICNAQKAKDLKGAVAAQFHPDESPQLAAVYCIECVARLAKAAGLIK